MSSHHLRKDKICQNCGQEVPQRFCTVCGQENTETRRSFSYLFRHFIEDFTHYEGNFWKTIKYLLFHPAYLTLSYLEGKRARYVAPVKLYIFVSFISFFTIHIFPDFNTYDPDEQKEKTLQGSRANQEVIDEETAYKSSLRYYDSLQLSLPKAKRDGPILQKIQRKLIEEREMDSDEMGEKLAEQMEKMLPKALFFFLPLFAFILWLFHDKKKYLYFDHGIFTLHYFSFILIILTANYIIDCIIPWAYLLNSTIFSDLINAATLLWIVYYFFRAHSRMYSPVGTWRKVIRPLFMISIEMVLFSLLIIALIIYSLIII